MKPDSTPGQDPRPLTVERVQTVLRDCLFNEGEDTSSAVGGGMSFLNACMDRHGNQWGEHIHIEQLVALGLAAGFVQYCMPREMWKVFPGGMPYFVVSAPTVAAEEEI